MILTIPLIGKMNILLQQAQCVIHSIRLFEFTGIQILSDFLIVNYNSQAIKLFKVFHNHFERLVDKADQALFPTVPLIVTDFLCQ